MAFSALTFEFEVWQYRNIAFKEDCGLVFSVNSANITVSSTCNNRYDLIIKYTSIPESSNTKYAILIYQCDIKSTKSLRNMENKTGDRFSPCLTPIFEV